MERRIVEQDVPTTTRETTHIVDGDGSYVGRTLAALAVIALLVLGAVLLFNAIGDDNDTGRNDGPTIENNVDTGDLPGDSGGDTTGDQGGTGTDGSGSTNG